MLMDTHSRLSSTKSFTWKIATRIRRKCRTRLACSQCLYSMRPILQNIRYIHCKAAALWMCELTSKKQVRNVFFSIFRFFVFSIFCLFENLKSTQYCILFLNINFGSYLGQRDTKKKLFEIHC